MNMNWCSFVNFFRCFFFRFRNRLRDAFVKHLGESSKVCKKLAFVNCFFNCQSNLRSESYGILPKTKTSLFKDPLFSL